MILRFVWSIPIAAPPEKLWRYIADTNRINQYAGLPEFTFKYVPEVDGGSRQIGETRYMGWRLRWDEHPFEWIEGRYYEIVRTYHNGPIRKFHTAVSLRENNGGTVLEQTITCTPRWIFAIPAIYWEIGFASRRRFAAAYKKVEEILQEESQSPYNPRPRQPIAGGRLQAMRERLANAAGREWLPRLVEAIETYPDEELDMMRPFELADRWKADRRDVLKLFLYAAQAGLLNLSWDVICPGCRGPQERHESLRKLRTQAHCPACNIRYSTDFAESVEVTFHPNPAIRQVNAVRYCSGGPMNAPHVVAQQVIPGKHSKTIQMKLRSWKYRLRSLKLDGQTTLEVRSDAPASNAKVRIHRATLEPTALAMTPDVSLVLENDDQKEITMMLERVQGDENAVTAATVIAMNEFRTLFSKEVLSPDTPISVGAVALMFTDLKASTALYEQIGEAPAYALVRRHFDLLRQSIASANGALIKTIGDSVMAAFLDPADAVESAFRMHKTINDDNAARGEPALILKIGIHHGTCITVNSDDILDYFGTTANVAARIQKESRGGDIAITPEIWNDPNVQRVLARYSHCKETEDCVLRGLTGTRKVYRIQPMMMAAGIGDR